MDDAEAETVLCALGPKLEWKREGESSLIWLGGSYVEVQATYTEDTCSYVVRGCGSDWWASYYDEEYYAEHDANKADNRNGFRSEAAAKAACERHHASRMQGNREGRWD